MMAITPISPVSPVSAVEMTAWTRLIVKTVKITDTVTTLNRRAISRSEISEEKRDYSGDFYTYNRDSIFQSMPLRSGSILDRYI